MDGWLMGTLRFTHPTCGNNISSYYTLDPELISGALECERYFYPFMGLSNEMLCDLDISLAFEISGLMKYPGRKISYLIVNGLIWHPK
jgi:hypothetical protein